MIDTLDVGPEEKRYFDSNGYALIKGLASVEEIRSVRTYIQEVVRKMTEKNDRQGRLDDYTKLFLQVTNAWRLDGRIAKFVFQEKFAKIAAGLIGVNSVRLYHDQALFKPPGGERTPWHQDMFYWPLDTDKTITMWMPLTDVTQEMGSLVFACGSHKNGLICNRPISLSNEDEVEKLILETTYMRRSHELKAGDATFHSGFVVHSAYPNRSQSVREAMTIIYFADGARMVKSPNKYQQVDANVFVPGARPGEPAASELNPVLYRADVPKGMKPAHTLVVSQLEV
ncbi:MAG TPA: phytanoyl-CoA dioxygenase family protein [Candidatus Kryptonia bacterium]